jgi:hypothetical protein
VTPDALTPDVLTPDVLLTTVRRPPSPSRPEYPADRVTHFRPWQTGKMCAHLPTAKDGA